MTNLNLLSLCPSLDWDKHNWVEGFKAGVGLMQGFTTNQLKEYSMQDFKWTTELVNEFFDSVPDKPGTDLFEFMQQFKSSKSPKKEWEIVAFFEESSATYWKLQEDGAYRCDRFLDQPGYPLQSFLDDLDPIHSVRRLSDSQTFSVGDKFKTFDREEIIEEFRMDGGRILVIAKYNKFYVDAEYGMTMRKLPQPILTTVDGVEIFDLDNFRPTVVFDDWSTNINADRSLWETGVNHYGGKLFSSNEVAQKYILENKPLLSLNDVKEAFGDPLLISKEATLSELTALVKQKLNQ